MLQLFLFCFLLMHRKKLSRFKHFIFVCSYSFFTILIKIQLRVKT